MKDAKPYTIEQRETERLRFARSADWELRNVRKALSLLPGLNTPEEWARLDAVKDILRERQKPAFAKRGNRAASAKFNRP